MKEEQARYVAEIFVPPEVAPSVGADELDAADGVKIPCPSDKVKECDSVDLLNEDGAGWVEEVLDLIEESERTSGQENNLGCALAWLHDWSGAKEAFERAQKVANATNDERKRARANARTAERHLA